MKTTLFKRIALSRLMFGRTYILPEGRFFLWTYRAKFKQIFINKGLPLSALGTFETAPTV
jgi:hypothetical protein